MQEKTLEKELEDLTCINGAMYFGSVETPCSGRETGECCQYEQTYEEAMKELVSFISSREKKLQDTKSNRRMYQLGYADAEKHYRQEIEAIITAYCDIDDYNVDKVMEDLTKLMK
jgi:uncharacterized Rmd1/YagE family protein